MSRRTAVLAVALALALCPRALVAQDTREATLAQQRAEKAKSLAPYEGGKLERTMLWIEDVDPLRKIAPHDGFYLQVRVQVEAGRRRRRPRRRLAPRPLQP